MKKSLIAIASTASALVLLLGGCGTESSETGGGSAPQTTSSSTDEGALDPSSGTGSTFENGVLTTPDMKIEITRHEVIKVGQKGNEYGEKPVIAFWYKATNVSGEKVDPTTAWISTFGAFQDNNPNAENELNVSALPDEQFLDSQTENIKKGGTVENAVGYELDDLVTPVDLVATEWLLGDVIGKITYKLP